MANSNSSTSLYAFQSNVKVSPNNFTTLYNSKPGSVATGNVGDRNFTTLYTKQSDITPTRPYGNANVEAFLNVGHDSGGNVVQNINMSGNLTVAKQSYLGNVGNVHITGGNLDFVLSTDGTGNLQWISVPAAGESVPYIHFDVTISGTNLPFTNSLLINYATVYDMAVMKNGVNIEPTQYSIAGTTLTILIPLIAGDTIDVLPSGGSSSFHPGGSATQVQYNNGIGFSGNASFTFDQVLTTLEVAPNSTGTINTSFVNVSDSAVIGNLTTTSANLGDVGNVKITGGTNGYVLQTDGIGNLSWVAQTGGSGNGVPGGSNTQVQLNIDGAFAGDPNLTFSSQTLNSPYFSGNGSLLFSINGSNVVGDVAGSNHANLADVANSVSGANVSGDVAGANHANIADVANNVSGSNVSGQVANALIAGTVYTNSQPNITSLGTLTGLTSGGTINFSTSSNVTLGTVTNLHITGGSPSQVLTTDGSGSLTWATPSAVVTPGGSNTQVQYNDNGTLAGTSALTFNNSTGNLVGSFGNITVSTGFTSTGDVIIQRAFEKFTTNVSAATGTVQFNVLDQSVLYFSANASANFTLNIRGNATTSLNSILPVNDTVTVVFLNTVGATAYVLNQLQIDGSSVTPVYVNGIPPTTGTRLTSAKQSYTYTIMKTGSSAYQVLGSLTEYR